MKLSVIIFPSVALCMLLSVVLEGWVFYLSVALVELLTIAVMYSVIDDCWQRRALKWILLFSCSAYTGWAVIDAATYYLLVYDYINSSFEPQYMQLQLSMISITLVATVVELAISLTSGQGLNENNNIRPGERDHAFSDGHIHRKEVRNYKEADR